MLNCSKNFIHLRDNPLYFALKRASEVANLLPTNHIKDTITTPHELVYGTKVDYRSLSSQCSVSPMSNYHLNEWKMATNGVAKP